MHVGHARSCVKASAGWMGEMRRDERWQLAYYSFAAAAPEQAGKQAPSLPRQPPRMAFNHRSAMDGNDR